jgi:hypothetical protein
MNDTPAKQTPEQPAAGLVGTVAGYASFDPRRYDWADENRAQRFPTWADEVAHMDRLGFGLVDAGYRIPHWSEATRNGKPIPQLYVCDREGAPREMNSRFDRNAAEIGYPLYVRHNT